MLFPENKSEILNYEIFKNPPSKYRGLPFWSWNCRLNKETISEQLEIFAEMGFGGVVIHPRDGLDTEYLGSEFLDMVKYAVQQCRQRGLLCWLYDDDRFPSGAAGGFVTKDPRFRARQLRLTKKLLGDGYCMSKDEFDERINSQELPHGYFCAAYSIVLTDKKLVKYRRLRDKDEISLAVQSNENVWYAYLELCDEEEWFEGQTYSDTMDPAAVDKFIELTHERYKSVLGDQFGTSAQAIFTDEPRIGRQSLISAADSCEDVFIPYTNYFEEQFTAKYGFQALDIIPEYVWDRQDENFCGRYIYRAQLTECFAASFMDKICQWCAENGILMTGHILGEETLISQTTTVGDAMRTYKNMDIPGIDILIDGREFATAKQAASVARQYGREAVMSELYGVTNWDCTFKTYKLQGDWQAALGITVRIPHLSHMSLEGEAKRDWPGSIFYQAPWYKEFKRIEDHFSRLNTVLTRGERIVKIAMLHPVESMWIKSGPRDVDEEECMKLDKKFARLTETLLYNTLDFDYISELLLSEQDIEYNGSRLGVGKASYEAVIVPDMLTIRDSTLKVLEDFSANGGLVIFTGAVPKYVHGALSERAAKLAQRCIHIPNNKEMLLDRLEQLRDIRIDDRTGKPSDNLFYCLRRNNSCKWLFISHVNGRDSIGEEKYTVKIGGEYSIVLYDTTSGKRMDMPSYIKDGKTVFEWSCYSEDSILLQLNEPKSSKAEHKRDNGYRKVCQLKEIVRFNRTEPNVLLLDYARFCIDGGAVQGKDQILRVDNRIRKCLGFIERTGRDRQPWATKATTEHAVTLIYDFCSEIEAHVRLAIENPEKMRIFLNGEEQKNAAIGWYVDKAIKVIQLSDIKKGKNELRIEIMYNEKTMLENLYLLGGFDVERRGDRFVIAHPNKELKLGDITEQGMPFYTGNLEYVFTLEVEEEREYFVHIPKFKAPLLGIRLDGLKRDIIAYSPHRASLGILPRGHHEITVVLYGNRFNSFGALHNANTNYVWYGNASYRTTGEEWTDGYMLRQAGIMSDIEIETK